jgi:thiosulfate/3-mercaptopyruvate sulfurtransferase
MMGGRRRTGKGVEIMKNVVSVDWLQERLDEAKVVDCRFVLGQPVAGQEAYRQAHLPGAVYADLEEVLSAPKGVHGGRHPLPDVDKLAAWLGAQGITRDDVVVAYDAQDGAMASWFWWLLRYLGHEKVYVLDGGWNAWRRKGLPMTSEVPQPTAVQYVPQVQEEMLVSMEEVRQKIGQEGVVLIDSREEKRYLGIEEPIDPVAGHIPGAINRFWKEGVREDGTFRGASEQAERFADLREAREIVVYCGSGVTACPNVLALEEAGFSGVRLYAGSWSDWISYAENEVETGKREEK